MSFFKKLFTKKETFSGVDSSKAFDELPKNYFTSTLISGILTGREIVPTVLDIYMSGPRRSVERYRDFAKKTENYRYRLPTFSYSSSYANLDNLMKYLERIHGTKDIILYDYAYGIPSDVTWAKIWLVDRNLSIGDSVTTYRSGGYIVATVSATVSMYSNDGSVIYWGNDNIYWGDSGSYAYTSVYSRIPLPPNTLMYLAIYGLKAATHHWGTLTSINTFKYAVSSLSIPELLPAVTETVYIDTTPIAIYKHAFTYLTNDATYLKEITNLTNVINVPSDTIINSIKGNPDQSKFKDVFLYFGVPIHTKHQASKQYIYYFFNELGGYADQSYNIYQQSINQQYTVLEPAKSFVILKEQNFNKELFFSYITKIIRSGSVGSIQHTTITIDARTGGTSFNIHTGEYTVLPDNIIIKHQINSSQFAEIKVQGIGLTHKVSGSVTSIGLKDKEDFLIPFSPLLLRKLSLKNSETVIFDAMYLTIYWQYTTKTTSFLGQLFKNFVFNIVIGLLTGPIFGFVSFKSLLINSAVKAVVQTVLSTVDPKVASILGLAMNLTGGFSAGGITNLVSSMSFADVLLKAVEVIQKVMQLQMMEAFSKLEKDWEDFHNLVEDYEERLEKARSMLPEANMDPLLFLNAKLQDKYYKDPSDFYTERKRTNLAPIMKSACTDFHSKHKNCWDTLPKFLNA